MKNLFTIVFMIVAMDSLCQTYTYIEPNAALEKEKRDKEAFFEKRKNNAFTKLQNCTKQCGSYAADANNPKDPCALPGATPACICACNRKYDDSIRVISQQENSWRLDIAKREQDYENQQKQKQAPNNQRQSNNNTFNGTNQTTTTNRSNPINETQTNLQNTQQSINNTIDATGNAIWNIIQSGKAKRQGITANLVYAVEQNIYDHKIPSDYLDNFNPCNYCGGNGIQPDKNYPCTHCNGIGKYYYPKQYLIKNAKKEDPANAALTDLVRSLNKVQESETSQPCYTFTMNGYNGTADLEIIQRFFCLKNLLVIESGYYFHFKKRNGKFDADAFLFGDFFDYTVIPVSEIAGVQTLPESTHNNDGNVTKSYARYMITSQSGETVEFMSNKDDIVNSLNQLIENAKQASESASSNINANNSNEMAGIVRTLYPYNLSAKSINKDLNNRNPSSDIVQFIIKYGNYDPIKTHYSDDFTAAYLFLVDKGNYNEKSAYINNSIRIDKIDTTSFVIKETTNNIQLEFNSTNGNISRFDQWVFDPALDKASDGSWSWKTTTLKESKKGVIKLNKDLLSERNQYLLKDFIEELKYLISTLN